MSKGWSCFFFHDPMLPLWNTVTKSDVTSAEGHKFFFGSQGVIWYQERVTATTWGQESERDTIFGTSFALLEKYAWPHQLTFWEEVVNQAYLCSLAPASSSWPRCYDSSQPPPPPFPVSHQGDDSQRERKMGSSLQGYFRRAREKTNTKR